MNTPANLEQHMDAYLAVREAVGLTNRGCSRQLRDFIACVQNNGGNDSAPIRAATAIAWAWDQAPATCGARGRADRLVVARGFLSYLAAIVPGTEVPAMRLVAGGRRRRPYIFTDDEMATLISAAARQKSRVPFRATVHSTLLGLLASTGLRINEAVRLRMRDVRIGDDHPNLQILETKFQKSRIVPLHPTVAAALPPYLECRRSQLGDGWSDWLFVNRDGGPLNIHDVGRWFVRLTRDLGIVPASSLERRPCLTSFRHAFAVRRLREWHKAGLNVQALLPTLAVYLGHVSPVSSYWYLSATPDLLSAAGARFALNVSDGGKP
jgi:integrase/recombinase XerD